MFFLACTTHAHHTHAHIGCYTTEEVTTGLITLGMPLDSDQFMQDHLTIFGTTHTEDACVVS